MLPTDKQSELVLHKSSNALIHYDEARRVAPDDFQNQHLYILSDDEIKEGDYCLDTINKEIIIAPLGGFKGKSIKKIIATTDTSLNHSLDIARPYPLVYSIPTSFIETFIKSYNEGKQLKELLVVYDDDIFLVTSQNEIVIKPLKDSYTREEVIEIILMYKCNLLVEVLKGKVEKQFTDKWIEKNL